MHIREPDSDLMQVLCDDAEVNKLEANGGNCPSCLNSPVLVKGIHGPRPVQAESVPLQLRQVVQLRLVDGWCHNVHATCTIPENAGVFL